MVTEAEVQTTDDTPQEVEAVPIEETLAPEPEATPEEVVEPEVLDSPPPPERLSREAVLEQYADVFSDERNTAAQQKERDLRRESGNREATKAQVKQVTDQLGVTVEDSQLDYLYDNAQGHAAHRMWTALGEGAIKSLGVEGVEADTLRATLNNSDPQAQETAAHQLMSLSNERLGVPKGLDQVFDMSVADVIQQRPDSKLAQSLIADREQRAADKAVTGAIEQRDTGNPAPELPQGSPLGGASGPTPEEYSTASRTQRQQWRRDGVEVQV